ncbi:SMP-30/gluconolactonase/LRE family protein [Thalassospira sp. MCCC 1A01428]|uniref:SMP-30/gluconolactonase/LRE family protein n=1 Tax=Thalassospira sp. MCCC 1A01428 TaxID=1470575 RepID=UPI000A1F698D|nr:SMP-30/gluconolactonase/LRE family protein [Thalassospira sp. MCCC 1A01428]OSQ45040.1 hypothetical protein THS27_04940 [Thalassospira sp. MCCC 1A01428]
MSFPIDPSRLTYLGQGLERPECVLATASGSVFVCDWRGGIVRLGADGQQSFIGEPKAPGSSALLPNGIALMRDGSFLAANLADSGGIWRITPDGQVTPFITKVDGEPLLPCNFVALDAKGRIWGTVSTRLQPRTRANRLDADDGFVFVADQHGARIVADGFGFTNEVAVDPAGEWLYVNETFGRRLTRLALRADGTLGKREVVASFGHGTFPDGLTFDSTGAIWLTSVISNRLIRVVPGEDPQILLEDSDPERVEFVEEAFLAGRFGAEHMSESRGRFLANVSSVAFGGPDLRTVYLGCLHDGKIASFRSPVAGMPPVHWNWG